MHLLFVRYAPGSCGNFLISLLQTDKIISSWNQDVQKSKNSSNFETQFKKWFDSCFTFDLENHLKHEPHHPYKLDFISAKHPRGDDLSTKEFIDYLHLRNDNIFLQNISENLVTVMRLNKVKIPKFGYGATVINIIIDQKSQDFFYKMRLKKLFGKEGNSWIKKEEHPEFLKHKFKTLHFSNQYKFDLSDEKFYNDFVVEKQYTKNFETAENITNHDSNQFCKQIFVNLSDLLSVQIVDVIENIFNQLNLEQPNRNLIEYCYSRYYQTNIKPFINEI